MTPMKIEMDVYDNCEVVFWRGQPINTLSREELERAFVTLARDLRKFHEPEAVDAMARGRVAQFKRCLR